MWQYFGGNYARRGDADIEMLAKMRLVMVEKWEGHCWADCLGNGTSSPSCHASCGVESDILDTFSRVKHLNPSTATVLYWNTLLAFPFYTAVGKFEAANALTIDSSTKNPISIRNDNGAWPSQTSRTHSPLTCAACTPGMEGIFVFGFDTEEGIQLYVDTVKNLTGTGTQTDCPPIC